eukprot:944923-Amphidinium_carterae.1
MNDYNAPNTTSEGVFAFVFSFLGLTGTPKSRLETGRRQFGHRTFNKDLERWDEQRAFSFAYALVKAAHVLAALEDSSSASSSQVVPLSQQ